MSLQDDPDFIRNCSIGARNALEPLIRQFAKALRQNTNPSIEDFLSRAPQENQDYLLHELLFEEKEFLKTEIFQANIGIYRKRFANFPNVLEAIFGPDSVSDSDSQSSEQPLPESVGRYRIIRRIGAGGFGVVWLAQDTQLARPVAIKAPRLDRFQSPNETQRFINEARTVARLGAHPNIVTLYDILEEDSMVYIVQEYIEGDDLRSQLGRFKNGLDPTTAVRIVIQVAQALAFAHETGFYHRDIKPENILIDSQGNSKVADFGLAIHEDHQSAKRRDRSGSPHYMSPERIRGETHRIDGRSDLWSLGIVLYELLTARRPFQGQSREELAKEICYHEPVPMRQWRPEIPAELERICASCLAKPKTERYSTARDLIEDLQGWLEPNPTPKSDSEKEAIDGLVPKGLRAFDREDQDVFIELLPGPRSRDGLPQCLRFWKKRIDTPSDRDPISVGVLYGPSGSGKTSLIQAGLLPRLSPKVQAIYLDRYDRVGEQSLCNRMIQNTGQKNTEISLPELASLVRSGKLLDPGTKLLLVLDQFEQWFSIDVPDRNRWTDMLRQCDGQTLSTLLLIRDDFWMQTTRLMKAIEIPMVEGVNADSLDLFSLNHAENVLRWLGTAYGCLPRTYGEDLSNEHQKFLKQSIERISDEGKVIPVKLAMFVEMMRHRPWTPSTLETVGGFEGLGFSFLEETFSSKHSSAENRYHEDGAKRILSGLLPRATSNIRQSIQNLVQLKEISGYTNRTEEEFQNLIDLLDRKLRLISPAETMVAGSAEHAQSTAQANSIQSASGYKLAHDYLIPSIRQWTTHKQTQTPQGRAELVLADRSEAWSHRKESQQLPTMLEWLSIRTWTRPSRWSATQTALMRQSDRLYISRLAATAGVLTASFALAWWALDASQKNQQLKINAIQSMDLASWDGKQNLMGGNPSSSFIAKLKDRWRVMPPQSDEKLKLALSLLEHDNSVLNEILDSLADANSTRARAIYRAIDDHKERTSEFCQSALSQGASVGSLGIAGGLAQFAPQSEFWTDPGFVNKLADTLLNAEKAELIRWLDHFEPVKDRLLPRLSEHLIDYESPLPKTRAEKALTIIEKYSDNQDYLGHLLIHGPQAAFEKLFAKYRTLGDQQAIASMRAEIAKSDEESDDELRANAALALLLLGQNQDVLNFITVSDDPERLTRFVFQTKDRGIPGELLIGLIKSEISNATIANTLDSDDQRRLKQRSDYLRCYGLLLGLGQCDTAKISAEVQASFKDTLVELYREHPSRAVHSATGWLMRQWGLNQEVQRVDSTPKEYDPTGTRQWYVVKVQPETTGQDAHDALYLTMLVFSSQDVHPKYPIEIKPGHVFALCDREVSWSLYNAMDDGELRLLCLNNPNIERQGGLENSDPVFKVSWIDANDFCNWINRAVGVDANRAFRLPSASEWQCAAAAGMKSAYCFGWDDSFLEEFDWYRKNTKFVQTTAKLPPGMSGLFDIHGNVSEWVTDASDFNPREKRFQGSNWNSEANQGEPRFESAKMRSLPDLGWSTIGFRMVQELNTSQANKKTE
jgi:serine/threonine protein kinase/formylglycine-generating enzyme required for sulfatase activity